MKEKIELILEIIDTLCAIVTTAGVCAIAVYFIFVYLPLIFN